MDKKDRKEVFLLVSQGGFLEDINEAWKDVQENSFFKMLEDKLKEIFLGKKYRKKTKSFPKQTTQTEPDEKNPKKRKSILENLMQGDDSPSKRKDDVEYGSVLHQSPIKDSWKNSGGWITQPSPPNYPYGHQGLDMRAPKGTYVYPSANGIVSNITNNSEMGGNTISIKHSDKMTTYYSHLDDIRVDVGEKVNRDTVIGTVGDSGVARKAFPHLHFGIRDTDSKDSWKNPAQFFSVPTLTPPDKEELKENVILE